MVNNSFLINKIFKNEVGVAVQSEDRSLSYSELRDSVSYLSSLIKNNGIYRTSIAICVPKDICHIVAILATIDSNNVFVPIDYKLPLKRIKMQFLEANIQFAIVNNETKDIIKNIDKNIIQINIDTYKINKKKFIINNKFDDLTSYIFFTSGSTGKPKAILGSYKGLWSFLEWEIKEFKVNSSYNISFISAIGFDPMLRDIFLPLLVGGTLFIPTMDELLDINKFTNWIKSNNINLIHIVPTLFKYLFNSCSVDDLVNLKYILLAGELLRGKDIEFFYKKHLDNNTKLINLYGPSESILAKFYHYISYDDLNSNFIPVGKPISHVKYKLIDGNGHTISDNSRGEIIIIPNFKLLGYYNNPEKNKEAFTKRFSFSKYYNSFKTGDFGFIDNGNLILTGREDTMVKVNGVRIDINEIENTVLSMKDIINSKVLYKDNKIILFYSSNNIISEDKIVSYIKKRLNKQAIPSQIIYLKTFPLNHSGKIDLKELNNIIDTNKDSSFDDSLKFIYDILGTTSDKLDLSRVDSLKLAKLRNALNDRGVNISFKDLFNLKSINDLKQFCINNKDNKNTNYNKTLLYCNILQEKMYYASKLANNTTYNIIKVLEFSNKTDINKLKRAIKKNINNIDLFKSRFYENKGKIYYKLVDTNITIDTIKYDKSINNSINKWIKIFDLNNDNLVQVGILEHNTKYYLAINIHHIISDEYSIDLLLKNIINSLYRNESFNYTSFDNYLVYSNNEYLSSDTINFTKDKFNGITNIDLPYDYPNNEIRRFNGDEVNLKINKTNELDKFIINNNITYYSLFNSVINLLLAKYSQCDDITVSSPVGIRYKNEFDYTFGPLINVVPFRNIINYNDTIKDYISMVSTNNSLVLDYPFIDISNILFEDKSNNINISYSFHDKREFDSYLKKYKVKEYNFNSISSKYKLMFELVLHEDSINLRIEYDTDLFKKDTISRMTQHFNNCLANIISSDSNTLIKNISFITKEEIELYSNLDNLDATYDKKKNIVDLFRDVCRKYPNNIAIEEDDLTITYKELDRKSNIIANYLLDNNITNETIGIISDKTINCITTMFGIIKSGNSYVPINVTYPSDRINFIIDDLKASTILISNKLKSNYDLSIKNLFVIEDVLLNTDAKYRKINISQEHPLYVIYTSGTTGKPKGAILTHRNLFRLLFNSKFQYDFTDKDKWTMFHSYCFDFSVWEMYGALLYGGKLVLIPDMIAKSPRDYLKLLKDKEITVLNQTPSYFYKLNEEEQSSKDKKLKLRYLIFGGEALDISKTKSFKDKYNNTRIINMYGITETCVHVTFKEITENDYKSNNSNIGSPIPTLKIVLLDKNMNLQVVGVPGEMYVVGDGVCNGYVNNEKLTNERFTTIGSYKMYKSGDLAKLMPSGELVYLGRNDDQVKIRGFRIELGEIENSLKKVAPSIKDLVISTRYDSDNIPNIVAYYTGDKILDVSDTKKELLTLIPEYMLPSFIIHVDSIPLTVNGKADRKLLNTIPIEFNSNKKFVEATNNTEKTILNIFSTVLGLKKISILDNFFDIGGNSFKALKASYMSNDLFTVQDLYENPTIKDLAIKISSNSNTILSNIYYYKKIDKPKANIVLVPYAGGETIIYNDLANYLKKYDINISVINANNLTSNFCKEIDDIVDELIHNNDSPFIIYSHCAGDGLGLYLNSKLIEKNATVKEVIIGASLPPTITDNEYFETDYWKNSTDNDIVKYLEGLDNSIDYNELEKLDVFISNFRRTVMIRRELLYKLNKKPCSNKTNALLVVGLNDSYTSSYKDEASNWDYYVHITDIITIENAQHYFINSSYKRIGDLILKYL